ENERDRRHQMTDADVQRTVHAVAPVEDDERSHAELDETVMQIGEYAIPDGLAFAHPAVNGAFKHPPEREQEAEYHDDERRDGFFKKEERREVDPAATAADSPKEVN